jgi:hypothetical protein
MEIFTWVLCCCTASFKLQQSLLWLKHQTWLLHSNFDQRWFQFLRAHAHELFFYFFTFDVVFVFVELFISSFVFPHSVHNNSKVCRTTIRFSFWSYILFLNFFNEHFVFFIVHNIYSRFFKSFGLWFTFFVLWFCVQLCLHPCNSCFLFNAYLQCLKMKRLLLKVWMEWVKQLVIWTWTN